MFVMTRRKAAGNAPRWLCNSMGSAGNVPEPPCTSLQELPVLCHGMAAVSLCKQQLGQPEHPDTGKESLPAHPALLHFSWELLPWVIQVTPAMPRPHTGYFLMQLTMFKHRSLNPNVLRVIQSVVVEVWSQDGWVCAGATQAGW